MLSLYLDASGAEQTLLTCSDDVLWPNSWVFTSRFCSTRPPGSGDFNVGVTLQLSMTNRPMQRHFTEPGRSIPDSILQIVWLLGSKKSTILCPFAATSAKLSLIRILHQNQTRWAACYATSTLEAVSTRSSHSTAVTLTLILTCDTYRVNLLFTFQLNLLKL